MSLAGQTTREHNPKTKFDKSGDFFFSYSLLWGKEVSHPFPLHFSVILFHEFENFFS